MDWTPSSTTVAMELDDSASNQAEGFSAVNGGVCPVAINGAQQWIWSPGTSHQYVIQNLYRA